MKGVILLLTLGWLSTTFAWKSLTITGDGEDYKKANCVPSTSKLTLQFNNVACLVETGGIMWQNRAEGAPSYEVPKGGGRHVIYSGSLWMGGTDVNDQLRIAAQLFRAGARNDFWPGPLTINQGTGNYDPTQPGGSNLVRGYGSATISPSECSLYDQFFTIKKGDVESFVIYFLCQSGSPDVTQSTCDNLVMDNQALETIINWPAHPYNWQAESQDYYLAPFYDNPDAPDGNGADGNYDPLVDGDYPWFDLEGEIDCRNDRRITLFGDETSWWVFNDNGNIHTETNGDPIGMEIRAQAFAFATNDEVNNMTFYNYELINRGTQTLANTYFAQYVDSDVGGAFDDYVGCDVTRGLGFGYNGDLFDEDAAGSIGYGDFPPAVGVDFFEGPYMDDDGKDNIGPFIDSVTSQWVIPTVNDALADNGIVYDGIGIGYSDGIVDNERYGMRKFVYFTNGGANYETDPDQAVRFYQYLQGIWYDGQGMVYGGTGHPSGAPTTLATDYAFPGDSDSLFWATQGLDPGFAWSEETNNNQPNDRRFVQSAGPFTLLPGAVNNITVGVVYARGSEGDLNSSVRALKKADTKAQALFDNCFEILDPPVAPILTIRELENELILYLSNRQGTNNFVNEPEDYQEEDDINIPRLDDQGNPYDRFFRFQGYQIFQMVDEEASVSDLDNIDKARLVAQVDIKDGVDRLINYTFNEQLGVSEPQLMVDGEDEGIRHSFSIKEDLFATGATELVNHKKYYYIAVAYAYNNFKTYDPEDPFSLDGQRKPYLRSRLSSNNSEISSVVGIPHDPSFDGQGTYFYAGYGDGPKITRMEGLGNGGIWTELDQASHDEIRDNYTIDNPTYQGGAGPLDIKIVDPLNVQEGVFTVVFDQASDLDTAGWMIIRDYTNDQGIQTQDTVFSQKTIDLGTEQLILDWGISVAIAQPVYDGDYTDPIEAIIEFEDSSRMWLSGIPDNDGQYPTNWIRSGEFSPGTGTPVDFYDPLCYADWVGVDDDKNYQTLLGGTIAPFRMVGFECEGMPFRDKSPFYDKNAISQNKLIELNGIDVYITSDKTKWTKCPVFEMCDDANQSLGGVEPMSLRSSPSIDVDGNTIGGTGMSYFPGYAIDVNTGKRLNMAFGENSGLYTGADNGRDMMWNPTSTFANSNGYPIFGGQHPVYIFKAETDNLNSTDSMPYYDEGNYLMTQLDQSQPGFNVLFTRKVFRSCMWVMYPFLTPGQEFLSNDVKISVRINKKYETFAVNGENASYPIYQFTLDDEATERDVQMAVADDFAKINVVPNPYYAYSEYETDRLDSRVKITNLPQTCTVTIYNVRGKLIRQFKKDDPLTSLDWDIKNHTGIPVAGGVYLIHVDIPGVGEKVLKWFGGLRQPDLENF